MAWRKFDSVTNNKKSYVKKLENFNSGEILGDLDITGSLTCDNLNTSQINYSFYKNRKNLFKIYKETVEFKCLDKNDEFKANSTKKFIAKLRNSNIKKLIIRDFSVINSYVYVSSVLFGYNPSLNVPQGVYEVNARSNFLINQNVAIPQNTKFDTNAFTLYKPSLLIDNSTKEKIRFFQNSYNEFDKGQQLESEYGDFVLTDISLALGYGDLENQSLFYHNNLKEIPLVVRDVNIEGNNIIFDVENQSNKTIKLNEYPILEQLPITKYNVSLSFKNYTFMNVLGSDKIVLSGPVFATTPGLYKAYYYSPIFITNRDATQFKILNDPRISDICYNEIIPEYLSSSLSTASQVYISALTSCIKTNNSNEYFVAFMDYDCCFYLYDSETEKWQKKRAKIGGEDLIGGRSNNINGDNVRQIGVELYNNTNLDFYGKKHLDMKDNLVLFTSYREFIPMIDLSIDGLNTFTNIFNGSTDLPVDDKDYIESNYSTRISINQQVYSKIINKNVFYSCFGCRINRNSGIIYSGPKNYFVKTNDGGKNWDFLLNDHLEYVQAHATERFISDDGNIIEVIAIVGIDANGSYQTYPPYTTPYFKNTIIFNRSIDGGKTWKYTSGNWSIVNPDKQGSINSYYERISKNSNRQDGLDKNNILIYHNKVENYTIVSYLSSSYRPITRITYNNGGSWENNLPFPFLEINQSFYDKVYLISSKSLSPTRYNNYISTLAGISNQINPLTTIIPRQGSDANDYFGVSCITNSYSDYGGRLIDGLYTNTGVSSDALKPNGKLFDIYNVNDEFKQNIFTFESQNKDIIDPTDTTRKLKNLEKYSVADFLFETIKVHYVFNDPPVFNSLSTTSSEVYQKNNSPVFITGGKNNILRKLDIEYTI